MSLIIFMIELDLYILGVTTFIYISNKFIRGTCDFINIAFLSVLYLKKPFYGPCCPAFTLYMINFFTFKSIVSN